MKTNFEDAIGKQVFKRKSGKPFKSGNLVNTVAGIINHPFLNIPAFTFEDDDSYVECRKCELFSGNVKITVQPMIDNNPEIARLVMVNAGVIGSVIKSPGDQYTFTSNDASVVCAGISHLAVFDEIVAANKRLNKKMW